MKKFLMFIFFFVSMCPVIAKAENATLEEEYLKGVYYVMVDGNTTLSHQQAIFKLDGKIAYCLEPEIGAKAGEYQVTKGLSGSYLSDENKKKIEEFGYYGYEYPGHQTREYYLAAQELIWENVSSYEVKWFTDLTNNTEINVENEKREILRLIEENKKIPSFHLETISVYEDEFLELHDENEVLERFEIIHSHFRIVNNNLVGQGFQKNATLKGTINTYDRQETLLYRQENSQKMATLRLTNPTSFEVSVIVEGVSMKIHKTGEIWNGIWNSGEWKNQSDVEFSLYAAEDIEGHFQNILYKEGQLVENLVTKNGYVETKKLPNGKYRLIETKSKEGYQLKEPITFEINSSVEKSPVLEIKNELSTGKVEILKMNEQGLPLEGVTFGLYSKGGRKLDEKTTDQNGKIVWERLPIGEYQIRELKTLEGYIIDTTKEKIIVEENKIYRLEKINVPMLPNTSGKNFSWKFIIGLFGLVTSKRFLC